MILVNLLVLVSLFLSACVVTPESPTVPTPSVSPVILLDKTVHFTAPDGTAVSASPGGYVVEVGDRSLRLTVPDSESPLVVVASPGTHDEPIKSLTPLSFSEEGEQADLHHIVVLFPDGKSLDAVGTYSGIRPRGFKDRLAQRPLIHQAIQQKEVLQARIHDRLFGGLPPVSAGPNAFNVRFNERATGPAPANVYLLTYLVTLIYPEFLDQLSGDPLKQDGDYVKRLHTNPQEFVQEYASRTHHLFWNAAAPPDPANQPPQFVWVWGSSGGWDPEAMVISTAKSVVVVIRGTDRVAGKKKLGYDWAEWIRSDFRARPVPPDVAGLMGLVHEGFWKSLTVPATLYVPSGNALPPGVQNSMPFRESLLAIIKALGGSQKPVWVVGHSLGAAHAQLYGAYLTVNGLSPQGIYAVAAPHVGNQIFVDQLNEMFPNQRLQRFDFVHDPVTKVPPPPYARAGTRVYYDDVKSVQFAAPERSPAEAARLAGLLAAPVPLTKVFALADFCFHYPQWHLNAAYNQLDRAIVSSVPSPLPTPVMRGDVYTALCGPIHVTRGTRSPTTVWGNIAPGE